MFNILDFTTKNKHNKNDIFSCLINIIVLVVHSLITLKFVNKVIKTNI